LVYRHDQGLRAAALREANAAFGRATEANRVFDQNAGEPEAAGAASRVTTQAEAVGNAGAAAAESGDAQELFDKSFSLATPTMEQDVALGQPEMFEGQLKS
jgi:hypothetical protein